MSGYSQVAWLPLTGGLTLLGLIASWFAWRRRGAAAGLRGAAWSLLPLAAYLVGVIELLWRFGVAIASFATSFVFSPMRWAGIIVVAVAVMLFGISAAMRRGRANREAGGGRPEAGGSGSSGRAAPPAVTRGRGKGSGADDDLGDVADILRRHGIR